MCDLLKYKALHVNEHIKFELKEESCHVFGINGRVEVGGMMKCAKQRGEGFLIN